MKRISLTFFIAFLTLITIKAQNLTPIFKSDKKTDELCDKARTEMLKNDNNTVALNLASEAKQYAISEGSPLSIAKANSTFGWIFLDSKNLPVAEEFVNKAFKDIEGLKEPEAIGILNHQYAIVVDKKGELKNALSHYFKAYKYYVDSKDYLKQAQVAGEISRIYAMNKDFETSDKYSKIEENLLKTHPNTKLQLSFNNKKNYVLMDQKKFQEAYQLNMTSAELAMQNKLPEEASSAYYNAAGAQFEMGNAKEAIDLVNTAINTAKQGKVDYTSYLVGYSQILMSLGKNKEAEELLLKTISDVHKSGDKFMELQARDLLTEFYKSQGKSEDAAKQFLVNSKIKDSISSAKQAISLKELEYQYKDEEKQKLLESYKLSSHLKNWLILLAFVLFAGALYLFFNTRKNFKLKQSLFEKKEKLLLSEKDIALKEKEIAQKEEEKAVLNKKLAVEEQKSLLLEKENTDRELASITLYVQEKNRMLEDLQLKMQQLLNDTSIENRDKLLEITRNLKQSISFEKDWDKIKLHFEKVHPDFFIKLSETYPNLTQNELKHCAYIKMNMSNKETANLLGVDHTTVKMSRYRIKKKINLSQEDDLAQFIQNI
ncbi:hypothetical protein [Soonwooa sp.]|uniref:tetratricopeptide repeat protein n=1 Tax=Soonwooa sp. TaxID=1938592 RepID=UPI002606619B|nr:hypothetical protein [Soonwooa sp.]